MAEQKIITKADIQEFHSLGKNIDDSRVNPYIVQAQQYDLEPVLGPVLYRAFVEDFDGTTFATARFVELFNGAEYDSQYEGGTIYFRGVRPMLCSFAYARIVDQNSMHTTRGGNVQKITEYSEQKTQGQQNQKSRDAVSVALGLQYELHRFLDNKRSVYPEWNKRVNDLSNNRKSFNFTRVGDPIYSQNYRTDGNKDY